MKPGRNNRFQVLFIICFFAYLDVRPVPAMGRKPAMPAIRSSAAVWPGV